MSFGNVLGSPRDKGLEALMNRFLRLCLCVMVMAAGLLGCQQGVTDVGNPNVVEKPPAANPSMQNPGPTLGQLIGGYSLQSPVASQIQPTSDGSGDTPPPSQYPASALPPSCKTDPQKIQSITPTSEPTQIVLNNFLDYGPATENLLASYDPNAGVIAFQITDPDVAFSSCTGLVKDSEGIMITLQCKARVFGESDCQVTYDKN